MENIYILPTYNDLYDEYGFGSWLKNNVGNIAQTLGGVALIATGAGVGAGAGMLASGIGGFASSAAQTEAEKQAQEDEEAMRTQTIAQNRIKNLNNNSINIPTFAKGGQISSAKAKEMLRDGTAHGKKLTAKQKRYFGWIAGGRKADGGSLPEGSSTLADAKRFKQLYPEQMALGMITEKEHTGSEVLASRIASDHIKDYLKMTGTPNYYSVMQQAQLSDELKNMKPQEYEEMLGKVERAKKYFNGGDFDKDIDEMMNGGILEYKNGGIYIKPSKRGSFTAWAKKHGMSVGQATSRVLAHKENYSSAIVKKANFSRNFGGHAMGGSIRQMSDLPNLSFFPGGGKVEPIYPIEYGKTRSFSGSNYIFDPNTQALNNYFFPENVIGRGSMLSGTSQVLPTLVGGAPGYVTYSNRTDLPPAGYRTVNGADTSYTYRNQYKLPNGVDTIAYTPGTRQDVANAMHMLNNPSGRDANNANIGVPSPVWNTADNRVNAYYDAIGKKRPNQFAEGGGILTEYKTGGSHETNPFGGIPIGDKARVEEGEVRIDFDDGSYIFSDRLPYSNKRK